VKCPACNGTGVQPGPFVAYVRPNCGRCRGRGTVPPPEVEDDDVEELAP
jgi:DnaJ-class molecular chaperone